jgi:hypothetical protein
MVTVSDPSLVTAGAGAASQGRNHGGTSSSGAEVHRQQMNLALLSSSHEVGGSRGGSLAVPSACGPGDRGWQRIGDVDRGQRAGHLLAFW